MRSKSWYLKGRGTAIPLNVLTEACCGSCSLYGVGWRVVTLRGWDRLHLWYRGKDICRWRGNIVTGYWDLQEAVDTDDYVGRHPLEFPRHWTCALCSLNMVLHVVHSFCDMCSLLQIRWQMCWIVQIIELTIFSFHLLLRFLDGIRINICLPMISWDGPTLIADTGIHISQINNFKISWMVVDDNKIMFFVHF